MALWTIADLHLSGGTDKPMDVFGERWRHYEQKIETSWRESIGASDTVVLGGDISWAIDLEQLTPDMLFLHALPGRKILLKGNHDYWWQTLKKMREHLARLGIDDIFFLQNDHYMYEDIALCGCRGWAFEGQDHERLILRECQRLTMSLSSAPAEAEKIVFMHYPPLIDARTVTSFVEIMRTYGVKQCYYGHLHGVSARNAPQGEMFGINFSLVSSDLLDFSPCNILK